ncbi:MAG TPA: hypothetical protein VK679_15325 [Gemmatimonadaceae bacterium]|jgi:hypothetical protein|nr:hypothetical protein [Gemmatimonadaceae bacterium]
MRRTSFAVASLFLSATAVAQTAQQSNGSIGSTVLGATGLTNGTKVTIQMLDSVTTLNLGATYNAQVSQALVGSNTNIPGGSPAVVKVVANTGYPATYSLALVSLTVNGAATPVSGGMPVLNKVGTAVNGAGDALGNAVGNIFNKPAKNQPKAPPRPAAAVSGTRIYVPSNSAVIFTLTSAVPTQTAQGQPAAGTAPGVAQPGQPVAQPAAAGAPAATTSNTVVYYQIQYQLTGCQRQAPHIICNVTVTNQRGGDIMLNGAGGAYYIDQSGNRVNADMRSLANCVGWGACQLVPNIAMAGQWQFMDQDNHATQLVRLQIHENGVPVAQFNNVPIN